MNHLMIDTETLGNGPDAAIFAIGAVFFDPFTGRLGKQFEQFIDPVDSERNGGTVNAATALWWAGQSVEARAHLRNADGTEIAAVTEFLAFISSNMRDESPGWPLTVWCKGASFDFLILKSAITRTVGEKSIPWCFWNERCMGALIAMAESTGWRMPDRAGKETAHTALGDAVYQAKVVSEIWQRFTTPFMDV
ncbi:TPA: 3'-5' exoribonuclease [Escherichia coli]|uniref:3'-5' exonuclease n=1 Tax=Escherichia coli TaxID=562 RepID=UPI000D0AFCF4|nr:3'-5' exonuclease [Escherichia coli]MBD3049695.1 3'-5' exoribonuclease [Escherichia coli]HDP7545172.1 3'-5' exoribonuclease [Escherichia coli]